MYCTIAHFRYKCLLRLANNWFYQSVTSAPSIDIHSFMILPLLYARITTESDITVYFFSLHCINIIYYQYLTLIFTSFYVIQTNTLLKEMPDVINTQQPGPSYIDIYISLVWPRNRSQRSVTNFISIIFHSVAWKILSRSKGFTLAHHLKGIYSSSNIP